MQVKFVMFKGAQRKDFDVVVGRWADGRLGTVRGLRQGTHDYGFTAFCERAVIPSRVDVGAIYRELLLRIVEAFQSGNPPLGPQELSEPVAFMEAALQSATAGGASRHHRLSARVSSQLSPCR